MRMNSSHSLLILKDDEKKEHDPLLSLRFFFKQKENNAHTSTSPWDSSANPLIKDKSKIISLISPIVSYYIIFKSRNRREIYRSL